MTLTAASGGHTDDLSVIAQLLPADPQAVAPHSGQLEAIHLLHVVAHWLLIPIAAGAALWMVALILALLGWLIWGLAWLVRRPFQHPGVQQ